MKLNCALAHTPRGSAGANVFVQDFLSKNDKRILLRRIRLEVDVLISDLINHIEVA